VWSFKGIGKSKRRNVSREGGRTLTAVWGAKAKFTNKCGRSLEA